MSLKTRVVLMVFVLLVAGIWTLALSIIVAVQRDITELISANLSAEVRYVADDLDRDIQMQVDALDRLAASLTPEILADRPRLDRALDQFADASVVVPDVCFTTDRNGIVTAGYPEHAIVLGDSVAGSAYFRQVMASGKPVIGMPVPASAAKQQPSIPLAVPLRDASGAPAGVLAGYVSLSSPELLGQLESTLIGRGGYFLVVSPGDRLILAAPDASRVLQRLPPRGAIPQLDRRLDEGFEGAGITQTATGVERLGVARKMATTGWMVLAAAFRGPRAGRAPAARGGTRVLSRGAGGAGQRQAARESGRGMDEPAP